MQDRLTVVLYEPQDDINIGTTVRACKNFGLTDVRLIRPAHGDPQRILISAPKADDVVASMRRFDSLDEAVADCVRVFGSTARTRSASWVVHTPSEAAEAVAGLSSSGRVALLFGREDHGLPNEAIDRCDAIIHIPTNPDYSSLNLGQAVLLVVWEMFRRLELELTAGAEVPTRAQSEHPPAPRGQVERMFEQIEQSLFAIEFFKYGNPEHVMRSIRSVLLRASLDQRELSIWFGIFKEIEAFLRRKGLSED